MCGCGRTSRPRPAGNSTGPKRSRKMKGPTRRRSALGSTRSTAKPSPRSRVRGRISCWMRGSFIAATLSPDGTNENGPGVAAGAADHVCERCLGRLQVGGGALAALGGHVVADLLALDQLAEAGALDGTDVHEHILGAVGRHDEAKTLRGVEPLHSTSSHSLSLA